MRVAQRAQIDDVERLADSYTLNTLEYIQARPGTLGADIHWVQSPRVEVRDASFRADVLISMQNPNDRYGGCLNLAGEVQFIGMRLTKSNLGFSLARNGAFVRLNHAARWANFAIEQHFMRDVAETHKYALPEYDHSLGISRGAHANLRDLLSGVARGTQLSMLSNAEFEDQLARTLLHHLNAGQPRERINRADRLRIVNQIFDFVHASYGEVVTITSLCKLVGVSERALQYIFRSITGSSMQQYLMSYRLHRAREALTAGEPRPIRDVAAACGIPHAGRFSQYYASLFGESPRETVAGRAGRSVFLSRT